MSPTKFIDDLEPSHIRIIATEYSGYEMEYILSHDNKLEKITINIDKQSVMFILARILFWKYNYKVPIEIVDNNLCSFLPGEFSFNARRNGMWELYNHGVF
jgi:hypothetical protein